MKKLSLLFALFLATTCVYSQKKPFALEDFYRIKTVADPKISPDGKTIAFVESESILAKGKAKSYIYLVDAGGGTPRRLTEDSVSENHPVWSPDGKRMLFLSSKSGDSQIWCYDFDSSKSAQLTHFSGGVSDAAWTSDGKQIVFVSDVFPECGADNDCNKKNSDGISNGPIRAHMADKLLYRHWTSWKDGTRSHVLLFDIETGKYTDLSPGDFDAPVFSLGGGGFAVSPDGKEVCFASNHDPNEAETTNADLFVVSVAGGEPRNITAENKSYDGDPSYSPDGNYIAYRTQTIPAYESDRFRLALCNRKTGEKTVLTEDFDNWVDDFIWAPDSKSIYFTGDVLGHTPLYRVDIKTKKWVQVLDMKKIDGYDIDPDGKFLAFVDRAVGSPTELWRVASKGGSPERLTFVNKKIEDEVDIRPVEEMWIKSPAGKSVHTFIVKPHDFDPSKKYPLILNVHGGPQSQWEDAFRGDWQMYPGSGYVLAFPNPHGSTGYGQEYTAEISGDWGGKVYEDLMAVTDSLAKLPYVDSTRMGAMGWSFGGYMMMWFEGHTSRFKAIACMMGVYDLTAMHGSTEELWFPQWDLKGVPWESNLYTKWSPNQFVKNFKTPCLVITGEKDFRVPYPQSLEFFSDLQKMDVPSRLIVFPNDGHWPSGVKSMPLYYDAHLDWFHKYLGGDPAPYDMVKMLRNQAFDK
ncbi:MAG TPA: S9 family peptidase [Bacteroidota bacterium]|nr:S9 family peptidase [Bacteroidota bacterium]